MLTSHTATDNDDCGFRRSGDSAEQLSAATLSLEQSVCAGNDRESTSDLTHGREKGKRTVLALNGLVRDRGGAGSNKRLGQGTVCRQVQVREEGQIFAKVAVLRRNRLLHLYDEVGGCPYLVGDDDDACARSGIILVREATAETGSGLQRDSVPTCDQGVDTGRSDRDTILVVLDFSGLRNLHRLTFRSSALSLSEILSLVRKFEFYSEELSI